MKASFGLVLVAVLAVVGAFASMQAFLPTSDAAFTDSDGDGTIDLAEEVFGSDPNDADSVPESDTFLVTFAANNTCFDEFDNDGDGSADDADTGCMHSDGESNFPDDVELRLGSDPHSDLSSPEDSRLDAVYAANDYPFAACRDGNDDDLDGLTDAEDPGCDLVDADDDGFEDYTEKELGADWNGAASVPEHVSVNPGSCTDAVDNDGDGSTDGADGGCVVAANDDLADAMVINSLPFEHHAKSGNATSEFGERESACSSGFFGDEEEQRGTLWYRYISPVDTHIIVDAGESDLLSAVSVWQESTFGLQEVDCITAIFYYATSARFAFEALAGETYFIQVERIRELADFPELPVVDLGRLFLRLEETAPPPNDDFADAAPIISLPFTASVDTLAASIESSEPEATCGNGYEANSVWYRYTPTMDTYVRGGATLPGTDFGVSIGVFEGTSLSDLEQVACGDDEFAFQAKAGNTYHLQAAGYTCQRRDGAGSGGIASFCIDSRAGHLELYAEAFELPTCPDPQFTFTDPPDDTWTYGPPEHPDEPSPNDISSVSVAVSQSVACVGVNFQQARDDGFFHAWLDIDTDLSPSSSFDWNTHNPGRCDLVTGLGADHQVESAWVENGIAARMTRLVGGEVESAQVAYYVADGSSSVFVVPLSEIGNDADIGFAVEIAGGSTYDCAPNGGRITCEDGACEFHPFRNGDANCATGANAIDAAIVLQYGAGLLSTLSCPDAADVDGNEAIDSRDAALILQYTAGLIEQLPPFCLSRPELC